MAHRTKTVFLGSPTAAIPSLRVLAGHAEIDLAGVVAQPDLPAGRRRRLRACPVKEAAQALGLPVFTPARIGAPEAMAQLGDWEVELAVVCAYGQIFPERVLILPALGCFNLHFSLLPRWRGASPVQAAILAGDGETGVSLQKIVRELDAGDIVAVSGPRPVRPEDTAETLGAALAEDAARLLGGAVPLLTGGQPPLAPQDTSQATFCRIIKKSDGAADFLTETAEDIQRKCRAYTPWPACHAFLDGKRLVLLEVRVEAPAKLSWESGGRPPPGVVAEGGLIAAREGVLRLLRVKPEGKNAMEWGDFQHGNPGAVGATLMPHPP
ncbi:MAG: methionyl-tRNA formyltransferase [bacterium]